MQNPLPEGGSEPAYPIASVNNALRLLLLFRVQNSVRLTEACQYLGVAHSTAHRLLAMLAYHGFVRQDPASRSYMAGPALVDVGLAVVNSLDVRKHARQKLEELSETFRETAHLAVLEGSLVRYLDAVESTMTLRVIPRTGALTPAHCTSVGKALLASLTDSAFLHMYPEEKTLEARTPRSIVSREALIAELNEVRRRGYAINRGESEEGVGSVAIAFRDPTQRPAAIALAAPLSRMTDPVIVQMGQSLQRAARELEAGA